jgi:hypothetical protein
MKKIVLLFLVLFGTTQVLQATQYSSELPGGKNYLDPNNFWNQIGDLNNIDTIKVRADQDYVVSVPGEGELANMEIHISGSQSTYVNGRVTEQDNCVVGQSRTYCTFHTDALESGIDIRFYAYYMDVYHDNHEMDGFQLEEGTSPTTYAPYVIPDDSTPPEIYGESAYYTSHTTFEALSTIINTHFTAYDEIDGDVSNRLLIEQDTYSSNEQIVGMYPITLSVSDTSGNRTTYEFSIIVQDTVAPTIEGPDEVFVDYDDLPQIRSLVRDNFFWGDDYDDRLSPYFIIDDYTMNVTSIGRYDVTFSITDSSNNSTQKSFQVVVEDVSAPLFKGNTQLTSYCSNPLSTSSILDQLLIQDNYNDIDALDVDVLSNTFDGNEDVVGTHEIQLSIKDESLNETQVTLTVDVIDDVNPVFDGPTTLDVSYTEPLTLDTIKALYFVSDNADVLSNSDIVILSDSYTSNESTIGTYTVDLKVEDSSGNLTTKQLVISVIDDIPPVIYTDEFLVTVNVNTIFEEEDALNLLLNSGELINQTYDVSTLINEYEGHETTPGQYQYSLELLGEDGATYQKDFTINVVDNEVDSSQNLLVRNIAFYSLSVSLLGVIIYRLIKKK